MLLSGPTSCPFCCFEFAEADGPRSFWPVADAATELASQLSTLLTFSSYLRTYPTFFALAALLLASVPAYFYGVGVPNPPPGAGIAAMAIGFVPPVPPLAGVPTSFSFLEGMKLVYYVYLW